MSDVTRYRAAIEQVAAHWVDPEHPARAEAVTRTLEAPNRFTASAIHYAVHQRIETLADLGWEAWLGPPSDPSSSLTVDVWHAGTTPLAGLHDLVAIVGMGHAYRGALASASPYLLAAFVDNLCAEAPGVAAEIISRDAVGGSTAALMATPAEADDEDLEAALQDAEVPTSRQLIRPSRVGVALIDGHESESEYEGLAQDMLAAEGFGARSVRICWAPRDLTPDPLLEAMAQCRGVFPAHDDTPGALQMQQAFLEARDQSHAYGDGLEFLVSRGAADVQRPGHVRWTEYDEPREAVQWMHDQSEMLELVVARRGLHEKLDTPEDISCVVPGTAHQHFQQLRSVQEAASFVRGLPTST